MSLILCLSADGDIATVPFQDDSLSQLQKIVDGYVECISVVIPDFGRVDIWLNEDGKGLELPYNPITSLICDQLFPGDYIAGDIAITRGVDDEGNTVAFGLSEVIRLGNILLANL